MGLPVAGGCGGPSSSEKPPAEAAAKPEPTPEEIEGVTAGEVLARLAAAYQSADTYFDNAEYHERSVYREEGVPIEPPPHVVSIAFERPRRLRIGHEFAAAAGRGLTVTLATDGDRLRLRTTDRPEQMLDRPAPETLNSVVLTSDEAINEIVFPVPMENLYPQLDLLLADEENPAALLAGAKGTLLKSKQLNGADCYRVRIDRPAGVYVLWIDKASPLLRRLDIPTDEVRRQLDPDNDLLRLELWIDFHGAGFGAPINFRTFQLEPAEGVELVESFGKAPAESQPEDDQPDADKQNEGTTD